jgi:hypothetical protein
MQTWLSLLFQERKKDQKETVLLTDSISFCIPLNIIECEYVSYELREKLVVDIYFYPDLNQIEIGIWNEDTGTDFSSELGGKLQRLECTYQNFMHLVREGELLAAKHWGGMNDDDLL